MNIAPEGPFSTRGAFLNNEDMTAIRRGEIEDQVQDKPIVPKRYYDRLRPLFGTVGTWENLRLLGPFVSYCAARHRPSRHGARKPALRP